MSYFKPDKPTPFQRKKMKEIEELDKKGINPFTVTVMSSGQGYTYASDDIRYYYESIRKPYAVVL